MLLLRRSLRSKKKERFVCRPCTSARVYLKRLTDFCEIWCRSYSQKFVDQVWVFVNAGGQSPFTEGGNRVSIRMHLFVV